MYVQTQTIKDIKDQFRLDPDGKVWATVKGTAALCGVEEGEIEKTRNWFREKIAAYPNVPELYEPFSKEGYEGDWLPEEMVVKYIVDYAMKGNIHARRILMEYQSVGFRAWIGQELELKAVNTTTQSITPPRSCIFKGRSNQFHFCPGWAIARVELPSDDYDRLFLIQDVSGFTRWVHDWAIRWEGADYELFSEYFVEGMQSLKEIDGEEF